jgi:hypothetical protein
VPALRSVKISSRNRFAGSILISVVLLSLAMGIHPVVGLRL